jgi:hypothetical protein
MVAPFRARSISAKADAFGFLVEVEAMLPDVLCRAYPAGEGA